MATDNGNERAQTIFRRAEWLALQAAVLLAPLVFWPGLDSAFLADKAILLFTLAVFAVLCRVARGEAPLPFPAARPERGLLAATAAGLLWGALSLAWAVDRLGGLNVLLTMFVPALFLPLFLACSRREKERLLSLLLGAAALAALYGILQSYRVDLLPWRRAFAVLAFSTMGNPNYLAGLLLAAAPVAIGAALAARGRRAGAFYAVAALCLWSLLSSGTRGAWLALLPALTVFAALSRRRIIAVSGRKAAAAAALVALVALAALSRPAAWQRLAGAFDPFSASVRERRALFAVAWRMGAERPGRGVGVGNFGTHYPRLQSGAERGESLLRVPYTFGRHAHNDYLQAFAEGGLPALALALFALGCVTALYRRELRANDEPAIAGAAAALCALALYALVNFPFELAAVALAAALLAAFPAAQSPRAAVSRRVSALVLLPLLAALVWLGPRRRCQRTRHRSRGQRNPGMPPDCWQRPK